MFINIINKHINDFLNIYINIYILTVFFPASQYLQYFVSHYFLSVEEQQPYYFFAHVAGLSKNFLKLTSFSEIWVIELEVSRVLFVFYIFVTMC